MIYRVFLICVAFVAFGHLAVGDSSKSIRDEISHLVGSESEAQTAREALERRPRGSVIEILRTELRPSPRVPSAMLKAAAVLRAREVVPELRRLIAFSESWRVYAAVAETIEALDRESPTSSGTKSGPESGPERLSSEFSRLYLERARAALPADARCAVLDGLSRMGTPLPEALFKNLIGDSNSHVRIAAVRNFVLTRSSLTVDEQARRYSLALALKPYQARLVALREFSRQPASERQVLEKSGDKQVFARLCRNETQADMQAACRRYRAGGE